MPLFEEYGVDVVFTGHDHCYERSFANGVFYIVTGGGGGPLYEQERASQHSLVFESAYHFCRLLRQADTLKVFVITPELEYIDSFKVIDNF